MKEHHEKDKPNQGKITHLKNQNANVNIPNFERSKKSVFKKVKDNAVLLGLIVIGFVLVTFALYRTAPTKLVPHWLDWVIGGLGTTLLSIGVVSFLYEVYLRDSFLNDMRDSMNIIVKESVSQYSEEIKPLLNEAIKENMPPKYTNIRESGIIDVYKEFYIDRLKIKIERTSKIIRILRFWFDSFDKLKDPIIKAINERNCKVQIILVNPDSTEAIEKRVQNIDEYSAENIQEKIKRNIRLIEKIHEKLNTDKKENIELRLHNSFISISYTQYDDTILAGFYLHNRLATNGTVLKISEHSKSGENFLYNELKAHFEIQYKNSIKQPLNQTKGREPE